MDRKPDQRHMTLEEAKARLRELDAAAGEGAAGSDTGESGVGTTPRALGAALVAGIACGRALAQSSADRRRTRKDPDPAMLGQAAPLLIEALLLGEAHLRRRRARRGGG